METLWEKLFFWRKKKIPKYRFQSFEDAVTWIEITSGKFAGVVFSITGTKFSDELGYPKLSFGYNLISCGKHDAQTLHEDSNFVIMMGDILMEIIINNESPRTDHPEESDL